MCNCTHQISSISVSDDHNTNSHTFHIPRAKEHIEVIDLVSMEDRDNYSSSVIAKLQFILFQCQLRLISFLQHVYLQTLDSLSLPHVQTLNKLYSSFGIENDFSTYLRYFCVVE